jgi:hypothetical protein
MLGAGGMGEVYEAEHVDHGRRVAVKILRARPVATARDRFLREGQLAATVHHPNCVYVFGAEEIAGTAIISMELLDGGTLRDQVTTRGPLPASEAVDLVLQVIAGLDAAHAAGVLHRDVKPSNCFVTGDGRVKVGDFGLSVSALADTRHSQTGSFQGTPHYASPEQLRGEPLDVRADIYSVGATLFYLLTGQPPFDHVNLTALLTQIATVPARSLDELNIRLPRRLAQVVQKCLAKDPRQRYATYAELAAQLRPFSSAAPTPAPFADRFVASVFDVVLVAGASMLIAIMFGAVQGRDPVSSVPHASLFALIGLAYWTLCEGYWGTSYGSRACGLELIGPEATRPGFIRAFLRAGIVLAPIVFFALLSDTDLISEAWRLAAVSIVATAFVAGQLLTFRRSNGRGQTWVHDLISGTTVVMKPRPALAAAGRSSTFFTPDQVDGAPHVGPYRVVRTLWTTAEAEVLLGFDDRLRRSVWIHRMEPGAPTLPGHERDVLRPTRLTWLAGRRTDAEAWDVFEAPDGEPLTDLLSRGQWPWATVRLWLLDLSREFAADQQARGSALLSLHGVWVNPAGRAWFVTVPRVQQTSDPPPACSATVQTFLADLATRAVGQPFGCLPTSARKFLSSLQRVEFGSVSEVTAELEQLVLRPDRVTPRQRGMSLALSVLSYTVGVVLLTRLTAQLPPAIVGLLPVPAHAEAARLIYAGLGVVATVLWRGGVWMRLLGIDVVTVTGAPMSSARFVLRGVITWSWVPLHVLIRLAGGGLPDLALWVSVWIALALAADSPARSLPDRLAGTRLIPR